MSTKQPPAPIVPLPERLPGEPERAYKRFLSFCLASGTARSVDAVWRATENKANIKQTSGNSQKKQSAPGSWYKMAEEWSWRDRASLWDRDVATAEAAELEVLRKSEREKRRALVSTFVGAAVKLLANAHAFADSPATVSAAVLRAISASRCEFPDPAVEGKHAAPGCFKPVDMPPVLELWLDGGEGKPLPLSQMPDPDKLDPDLHPEDDGTTATPPDGP